MPIKRSELSQKEKNKNIVIITHIYGIKKKRYWWTYLQGMNGDADVENRPVNTVKEGGSGTNGESSINIYTLSDKTDSKIDGWWEVVDC